MLLPFEQHMSLLCAGDEAVCSAHVAADAVVTTKIFLCGYCSENCCYPCQLLTASCGYVLLVASCVVDMLHMQVISV